MSLYIQFFGLLALMLLEPSASLTLHYAVPPSLCHRTFTWCFTTPPHALWLVSTRIPCYPLSRREMAPSPSTGLLLYHHDETPSLFAKCSLYRREKTPPPSTVLSLCLREETPSLSARCLAVGRLHCHSLFSHCVSMRRLPMNLWMLSSIALPHFSIVWPCHSYSSGNVWYTRMFYLFLTRKCSSGLSL
jgi:hypothetical protein